MINSEIRPNKKVEKPTWTYNYDSLGRIATAWEIDSILTNKKGILKSGYGYIASYDQRFEKHKHFRLDGNRATITHCTYRALDNSMDSTRMPAANSNLDYTFTIYHDEKGRDTLSIQRNWFGVITNKNITQYGQNSITRTHADGAVNVNKTVKVEFGENGLITKEETFYAATLKTTVVIYQYEFYK